MEIELYGEPLTEYNQVLELLDQMHTLAMESCGALADLSKSSKALDLLNTVYDNTQVLIWKLEEDK